jgi:REP element-mobilizing transposase RayT
MARKLRLTSDSGIYHVILRGVNRQDIFENEKDFLKFLSLMERLAFPVDETGHRVPPLLVIYAYCLMPNHVHLLVREQKCGISAAIKWISGTYAGYFNVKYEHVGHLFQDRFRSEVVNDWEYFLTLMRYIHQNPIAGGLVDDVRYYRWSSWRELDPGMVCDVPICATGSIFTKISFDALEELVDTPLPKTQRILDFDSDTGGRVSDERVREFIKAEFGIAEVLTIQHLEKMKRNEIVKKLLEFCGNVRQISRVTGICRGVISRLEK